MPISNFETKTAKFIDAYIELQDMAAAARKTGMNMLHAYKILKISGVMLVSDRLKYGTAGSKMGAMAEIEFQKLVPSAKQMNSNAKQNAGFDFLVGKNRVDIKASSLRAARHKNDKNKHWAFPIIRNYQQGYGADFYVLFLAINGQKLKDGYDLYVIPSELLGEGETEVKCITISESNKDGHWVSDFKINSNELNEFFSEISLNEKEITHKRGFFKIEVEQLNKINSKIKQKINESSSI